MFRPVLDCVPINALGVTRPLLARSRLLITERGKASSGHFRVADYTGVGPDFVQMRAGAGYDLVRYMAEALRVGDTR